MVECKNFGHKAFLMVEFIMRNEPLTNLGSYQMTAKHQKINFIIFAKTVMQQHV
jgi:hypothetical protein